MGEQSYASVRMGNILAMRTLVLIWVAQSLGVWWILEQPKGSSMALLPGFQELLRRLRVWKHTIYMRDYGGPTSKPTWLYSSHSILHTFQLMGARGEAAIQNLADFAPASLPTTSSPREMAVAYTDSQGRRRVKGGRHLKASQSYPLGLLDILFKTRVCSLTRFGQALARLRSREGSVMKRKAREVIKQNLLQHKSKKRNVRSDAKWCQHAGLNQIFDFLA